jgi:hypothetical protein
MDYREFYFLFVGNFVFIRAEHYATRPEALKAADDAVELFERPVRFVNDREIHREMVMN